MIKSGLKIYKNNIWEVFALLGFISIGLVIGFFVLFPLINSLTINSLARVGSSISDAGGSINLTQFINEFQKRINSLDWANPVRAIRILYDNNGLFDAIIESLKSCGVKGDVITKVANDIHDIARNFLFSSVDIGLMLIAILGASTFVGYLFTRIIIQDRSTKDHNIGKFILSFIINLVVIALIFFLILLSLVKINGPLLYLALVGIFMLLLLLSLIISVIIYRDKEIFFRDLFNLKSFGSLILSSLIVVAISGVVIILVFIFSDFIALYIALPLLIVTNIVIENIAIRYVTEFKVSN